MVAKYQLTKLLRPSSVKIILFLMMGDQKHHLKKITNHLLIAKNKKKKSKIYKK